MPDDRPPPSSPSEREAALTPSPAEESAPLNAPADADGFQHATSDPELIRLWLSGKAENTRRAYRRDLEAFIDRVDKPIRTVTLGDVQAFWRHLEDERALAAATVSRKLATVKSLFTFAHKIGYVQFNTGRPVTQPTPRRRLAEKLLTAGEVHRIFAAADSLRNRAICRLFYGSALRRSELAALQWRDVTARPDLPGAAERGQVTVFGKGAQERAVLLNASTWTVLQKLRRAERAEHRGASDDPLFWSREGGALTGTQIYNVVRKAARRAGIEKPVSPHSFRHAHLSHALDRGATIEEARETAGHNSIQTTSVYVHARPDASTSDYLPD
jgi:integrase/recombinase XerD